MNDEEKLELVRQFAYNCGDCGKGGCFTTDCMGWVFQQILADKPFGICDWCGGAMAVSLSEAMQRSPIAIQSNHEYPEFICAECRKLDAADIDVANTISVAVSSDLVHGDVIPLGDELMPLGLRGNK